MNLWIIGCMCVHEHEKSPKQYPGIYMLKLIISKAKLKDMQFFLTLAKEEGWNPGFQDDTPFYCTDPNGFFIAELDGEKIGCISAVAYNQDFGFMGFYIIIPKYRGQGFGLQLWNHAVEYLGTRCVGLDGVVEQQDNYKKSHFQFYYKNIRFQGKGLNNTTATLTDLQTIPLDVLLNYDTPIFGLSRKTFLEHWIKMPNAHILGKMEKNCLSGYGIIRSCANGYKIGPLFADNFDIAKEIYQGLCIKAENNPVFLDVPAINPKALQLAEEAKLEKVFETARMYNKTPPKQQLDKVFGVTTFELG